MAKRMSIRKLVKKCLKYRIEFSMIWDAPYEGYFIDVVLHNGEYVVSVNDQHKIAELWNDIYRYYIRPEILHK